MTRYVLGERIGIGGMAEIFRAKATAPGGFEKPVAIKRILPHLSQDKRFVNLLIKEAKLLSQLRHRNIVQIFDVGLGTDGQYFLVMEYVDGTDCSALYDTLQERKRRLPIDLALHIGAEVCDALHHAHHAKGTDGQPLHLVHRDVSPANILLSRSGEVKLTDFGIAKQKEESTGHGAVRGKFAYISPEQASSKHVDGRSDVYSLGVVLYELILGHRLYSGLPDYDALKAVREGHVRRPREIDPKIPTELEELLLSALSHDPDARFPSANDFGTKLRGLRYSMPTTGMDPAKEISRVLAKYSAAGAEERMVEREPTIVRIRTAAGFGFAPFETKMTDVEDDDDAPFNGAAAAFDAFDQFDDEKTTHLQPDERALMAQRHAGGEDQSEKATIQVDTLSQEQLLAAERAETARDQLSIIPQAVRAATPTVKDQFHAQQLMANPPLPSQPKVSETLYAEARSRRRRALIALVIAAVLVSVGSFVVASMLMKGDKDEESSTVDAGPADAGTPDAAPPPPEKKKVEKKPPAKKKPKKRRRRKR